MQNPTSDNTNVLWNSPSLGKITDISHWFYKTNPFLSLEVKKTGLNLSIFSGIAHYLIGMRQKNSQKSVELHCFEFQSNEGLIISVSHRPVPKLA